MAGSYPGSKRPHEGVRNQLPSRTRLVDVAAEAKVSKSIASRILNGYPGLAVKPETKQRVLDAAARLAYTAHAGALAVAGAQTGAVAFLVPPLSNPVYVRILRGAFAEALLHDLVVLLVEDLNEREATTTLMRLVSSRRIDGVIMASATPRHPLVRELRTSAIPHVFVNRAVPRSHRNVVMDDASSSEAVLQHLAGLGHRAVGFIGGPPPVEPARRRERAFLAAAGRTGVDVAVVHAGFNEKGGADGMSSLIVSHPDMTALYTSSLSQAVGVLGAAASNGVVVPDALSVIAYDDMAIAEHLNPPLTTVRMPLGELGAAAVKAVSAQLDGQQPADRRVDIPPELVVRNSTAPPRDSIGFRESARLDPEVQPHMNKHVSSE